MTSGVAAGLRRRDRRIVLTTVGLLAAASWWLLLRSHAPGGHGAWMPHHATAGGAGLAAAFALWMLMMAAMMLPAVLPWILFFASLSRDRDGGAPHFSTSLFVAGYFAAWAGFCLAAAGAQRWMQAGRLLGGPDLRTGALAGGLLLVAAGLFQWSPWKAACLRHCRTPLAFFLSEWRDGPAGAFRMGLRHGLFCLGCCWALMALSFALGVMNLLWMAALTLLLCVEKIAPGGPAWGRALGLALVAWGAALVVAA